MNYVKIGSKAETFYDSPTGFGISKGEVKELTQIQRKSPRISKALNAGHLANATEKEYDNYEASKPIPEIKGKGLDPKKENTYKAEIKKLKEDLAASIEKNETLEEQLEAAAGDPPINFSEKTKAELIKYYEDTYQVTTEEIAEFAKKNKEGDNSMVEELEKLAEE